MGKPTARQAAKQQAKITKALAKTAMRVKQNATKKLLAPVTLDIDTDFVSMFDSNARNSWQRQVQQQSRQDVRNAQRAALYEELHQRFGLPPHMADMLLRAMAEGLDSCEKFLFDNVRDILPQDHQQGVREPVVMLDGSHGGYKRSYGPPDPGPTLTALRRLFTDSPASQWWGADQRSTPVQDLQAAADQAVVTQPKLPDKDEAKHKEAVQRFGAVLAESLFKHFAGVNDATMRRTFGKVLNGVLDNIEDASVAGEWFAAPWECEVAITKDKHGSEVYTVKVPELRAEFILTFDSLGSGGDAKPIGGWINSDGGSMPATTMSASEFDSGGWFDEMDLIK